MNAADIQGDYRYWDNREDATFVSHANSGDSLYAMTAPDGKGAVKRRPVRTNEVIASGGAYTKSDRVWLVPNVLMPAGLLAAGGPKPGDSVRDNDAPPVTWTVLDVERIAWGSVWKLTSRNLIIAAGLKNTIDIQRPAITLDAANVTVRAWPPAVGSSTPYAGLACRIQPLQGSVERERDVRGFKVTHEIYLSQEVALQPDDRIKDLASGTLYTVAGYHASLRIGELPVIEAEIIP